MSSTTTSKHHQLQSPQQSHRPQNYYEDARPPQTHPSPTQLSKPEEIDVYAQQLIEYTARTHHQQQQHQQQVQQQHSDSSLNDHHIDDSLGSYITNCLRTLLSEMTTPPVVTTTTTTTTEDEQEEDVTRRHNHRPILARVDITTIPDYESFCELIQEHCQLLPTEDDDDDHDHDSLAAHPMAVQVLQKIWQALVTRQIPSDDLVLFQTSIRGSTCSTSSSSHRKRDDHNNHDPSLIINVDDDDRHSHISSSSSLLLQMLPEERVRENDASVAESDQIDAVTRKRREALSTTGSDSKSIDASNVSSSNNNNNINNGAVPSHPNVPTVIGSPPNDDDYYARQQYDETSHTFYHHHHPDVDEYIRSNIVNLLLQWYVAQDLSYDAAYQATCLAQNNVILAQYIISSAFTQVPICKHLLNDGKCYRADCTFNHNMEHHTCVFWMKSRGCSKQDSAIDPCRFLHGFSSKLLEQIPEPIRIQAAALNHSHNNNNNSGAVITPYRNLRDFYATSSNGSSSDTNPTTAAMATGRNQYNNYSNNTNSTSNNAKSFANIASKGYNTQKSFTQLPQSDPLSATSKSNAGSTTASSTATIQQVLQQLPTMLIPQNLWQAHENRNASAFYISDPIERYHAVSSTTSIEVSSKNHHNSNNNVIDLHFQSIKTFPVVLDTILPTKLSTLPPPTDHGGNTNANYENGIWIITGTGHHVNTQRTHQKGGSTLESAVLEYLISNYLLQQHSPTTTTTNEPNQYRIYRGRDRNGKGGAIFIQKKL